MHFKQGEIIRLTAGYHEEYHTLLDGIVLRDFADSDMEPYFQANPDIEEGFSGIRFAKWLVTSGFVKQAEIGEFNVGGGHDYSPRRR